MDKLEQIEKNISIIHHELHDIKLYIEDSKLTEEEKTFVAETLKKIKKSETEDFTQWETIKREL